MKFKKGIESLRTANGEHGYTVKKLEDVYAAYVAILGTAKRIEVTLLDSYGEPYDGYIPASVKTQEIPFWGDANKVTEFFQTEVAGGVNVMLQLDVWEQNGLPVALYLHSGDYVVCKYLADKSK